MDRPTDVISTSNIKKGRDTLFPRGICDLRRRRGHIINQKRRLKVIQSKLQRSRQIFPDCGATILIVDFGPKEGL